MLAGESWKTPQAIDFEYSIDWRKLIINFIKFADVFSCCNFSPMGQVLGRDTVLRHLNLCRARISMESRSFRRILYAIHKCF